MFCIHCGAKNEDDNKFCTTCGKKLEDNASAIGGVGNVQGSVSSPEQNQQQSIPQNNIVNNEQKFVNEPSQQNQAYQKYSRGCAGQAWDDIKIAGSWFGRALLLALIALVPVLNFCAIGYGYSLSRHAILSSGEPLPRKIVNGENFKWGFFVLAVTLISLIFLSVFTVLPTVLFFIGGIVPVGIVFVVFSIVVWFFVSYFIALMNQRACLISFGAAFNLGKVWSAFKSKFGSLFAAGFLPSLLFGLIGSGLAWTIVIPMACSQLSPMTTCRGYGIYIKRYVPEWVEEICAAQGYFGNSQTQAYQDYSEQPQNTDVILQKAQPQEPSTDVTPIAQPVIHSANQQKPEPEIKPVVDSSFNSGDDCGTTILSSKEVVLNDKNGKSYSVVSFPAVVGKGSKADCIIKGDNSVSRQHAKIHEYGDDGFVIEDLNSSNKTYLNGEVLTPEELVILSDGDNLKMGKTELTVSINL